MYRLVHARRQKRQSCVKKSLHPTFPNCLLQIHIKTSRLKHLFYLENPPTTQICSQVPWERPHSHLGVIQRPESYRKYPIYIEDLGETAAESGWNAPTTKPSGQVLPRVWNLENTCLTHIPFKWSARPGSRAHISLRFYFSPRVLGMLAALDNASLSLIYQVNSPCKARAQYDSIYKYVYFNELDGITQHFLVWPGSILQNTIFFAAFWVWVLFRLFLFSDWCGWNTLKSEPDPKLRPAGVKEVWYHICMKIT